MIRCPAAPLLCPGRGGVPLLHAGGADFAEGARPCSNCRSVLKNHHLIIHDFSRKRKFFRKKFSQELIFFGVRVSALGSPIGKISIQDDFEPHFEKFRYVVELAKLFETPYIRMFSFYIPADEDPENYREPVFQRLRRMVEYAAAIREVCQYAQGKGVDILLESHGRFNTLETIGGNVLNTGHLISDFPEQACVEVPCLVNGTGIHPTRVGALPPVLAAMNMTNINTQLLTIEAARTRKKEDVIRAAMLDPHTAAELSIDDIVKMVDERMEAHGLYMEMYR